MASNSFTNLGATPYKLPTLTGQNQFLSSYGAGTPQAKALNNVASAPVVAPAGNQNVPTQAQSRGFTPAQQAQYEKTLGMFSKPETPLKSITTGADGTQTATYHAPVTPKTPASDANTPKSTTFPGMINTGANIATNAANQGATNYNAANQGLISSLGENQNLANKAQNIATTAGQTISDIGRKGAMGAAGYRTTGTSPVGEGNAAVLNQTTAAQQNAVAQGANMELQGTAQGLTAQGQTQTGFNQAGTMGLTGQGQGISGLNTVAGLISPTQVPYSTQFIDPLTGKPVNGGTSGNLNDSLNSVIAGLKNGTMSYADAQTALSGYGQGGQDALTKWATDNNFNIAQSNTLAGTQGTIKPAFDYANLAMDNLKNSFSALSVPGQASNTQPIADITNWFSNLSGIGKEAVRTKEGALAEARSAIQKVLASIQGGTPTDYTGQSHALLPDNATPADVDAARANLAKLGQGKIDIYGNPGQSNTTGTGESGTVSAGGFNFKMVNGQYVPV